MDISLPLPTTGSSDKLSPAERQLIGAAQSLRQAVGLLVDLVRQPPR